MKPKRATYQGHGIELSEGDGERVLLIDDEPVRDGTLPDGQYYLHTHAREPARTDLQEHVLDLLGVPTSRYRPDA